MNALITKIERREVVIIERPAVEVTMGGAICFAEDTTQEEFLTKLAQSLKIVESMGGMIPANIEIVTDGEGNFAAKMPMGF